MTIPIITAFASSPDRGRGLARDMPVRWALEEVGQAYEVRPVSFADLKKPAHRARQPFGQIPSYEDGGLVLFESGAIVLHIAEMHPETLLPAGADGRARAIAWMFAALNTVEPPVFERDLVRMLEKDEPGFHRRLARLDDAIRGRLADLSRRLDQAEWLEGAFSAGDLMMVTVLRRPNGSELLATASNVAAYVARGEARPAFRRAFAAQAAAFEREAG